MGIGRRFEQTSAGLIQIDDRELDNVLPEDAQHLPAALLLWLASRGFDPKRHIAYERDGESRLWTFYQRPKLKPKMVHGLVGEIVRYTMED